MEQNLIKWEEVTKVKNSIIAWLKRHNLLRNKNS